MEEFEQQIVKVIVVLEFQEGLLKGYNFSELFFFEFKVFDFKDIFEMIVLKEYSFKKGFLLIEVIENGFGGVDQYQRGSFKI